MTGEPTEPADPTPARAHGIRRTGIEALEDWSKAADYGRLGLDAAGIASYARLTGETWSSDSKRVVVKRLDLQRVLICLDNVSAQRGREVPRLEISDEEYQQVVTRHLHAAARIARGVTPLGHHDTPGLGRWASEDQWAADAPTLLVARRLAAALSVPIGSLLTESEPTP